MNDLQDNPFAPPLLKMLDLNAADVFIGMALAFILAAILTRVIRAAARKTSHDQSLSITMILMSAIVSLIMAVIGNSLARAFGAIGALSLIRFRTAVKSSNDLAYLFMAISIGMACGSGYFAIATGATGLFTIFIVLVERFFNEISKRKISLLKILYPNTEKTAAAIIEKIAGAASTYRILSQETFSEQKISMLVEVTLPDEEKASDLIRVFADISPEIICQVIIDQSE